MARRRTRAETVEEVEWFLEAGLAPIGIEAALGIRHQTMLTIFTKTGRKDLTEIFRDKTDDPYFTEKKIKQIMASGKDNKWAPTVGPGSAVPKKKTNAVSSNGPKQRPTRQSDGLVA